MPILSHPRWWSPAEDAYLSEITGDIPPVLLAYHYNAWATNHGYSSRTQRALYARVYELGLSAVACGNWINSGTVARCLEIPPHAAARMLNRHHMPRKLVGRIFYFTRRDLKNWARQHPQEFGGFQRSNLIMLLEDESLVDSILERFPHRYRRSIRIHCPTLRRTFNSATEAAKALHVDHSTIPAAIKAGRNIVGGIPFEVLP